MRPVGGLNGRGRPSASAGPRKLRQRLTEDERAAKERDRERRVERTYKVPVDRQHALQLFQWVAAGLLAVSWRPGRTRCWGCRRATGASKALATDHNHRTGEVRMYLCSTCNNIVGHFRDDPEALIRLGLALIDPPSRQAWMAPGAVRPGWACDDQELLDLVAERVTWAP